MLDVGESLLYRIMEAIILAGGLGTRLRSEVKDVPKCLAPVAGKPFLWYILTYLKKYDIDRVILSVGYLREAIFEWIDAVKAEFPFEFDYAIEDEPLGTGGGIKLAMSKVKGECSFVFNGDTFFNVDLNILYQQHLASGCDISLSLKPLTEFERYGAVEYDITDGKIISFKEKAYCKQGVINGGVYAINKNSAVFDNLPDKFSFESQVLEKQCVLKNLYGVVQDGYFIDIGVPEDYKKAQIDFKDFNALV